MRSASGSNRPPKTALTEWNTTMLQRLRPHILTNSCALLFSGNEELGRWLDVIILCEVTLIDGEREAPARIDIEQRLADRDVTKGLVQGNAVRLAVQDHRDRVTDPITKLREHLLRNIEDEIAEWTVGSNHLAMQSARFHRCLVYRDSRQLCHIQRGARLRPVIASRQVRPGRRKDIAAVKRRRQLRSDHPLRIRNLPRLLNPVAILHQRQQPVIRHDEELSHLRFRDDRLARTPHAWVDHAYKYGIFRKIRSRPREEPRALSDIERRHLVCDVDDANARCNTVHDRLADADGIVLHIEIRHESDDAQRLRRLFLMASGERKGNQSREHNGGQSTGKRHAVSSESELERNLAQGSFSERASP